MELSIIGVIAIFYVCMSQCMSFILCCLCVLEVSGEISVHAMAADKPVLLYAHPLMEGLAKAIVASCEELKTNTSAYQRVRF